MCGTGYNRGEVELLQCNMFCNSYRMIMIDKYLKKLSDINSYNFLNLLEEEVILKQAKKELMR